MTQVRERPKARTSDQAEKMAFTIRKIGVIGAGQMGNGIAHVCGARRNGRAAQRHLGGPHQCRARHHQRQSDAAGLAQADRRGGPPGGARAHRAGRHARQARRLRSRHRVRDREGRRQAQDLRRPLPAPEARRDRRHQHVVDLDHAARRLDRPAGALHRHSLHESGAGDGAGRADPRHRDRRHDVRGVPGVRQEARTRRSRSPRISRPSSSTASCCR